MLRLLLALMLLLPVLGPIAGCSDDGGDGPTDPGDDTPEPHEGVDEILFRVYVDDGAGGEALRWIGDPTGPTADSPESTDNPFVPFGRPFRIEWEVDMRAAPVVGTRFSMYEVSDDAFFLPDGEPGEVLFDDVRTFRFANATPRAAVDPSSCETGPDCFGDLRFGSGQLQFEVQSINENERILSTGQTLFVDVNYPPVGQFVQTDPDTPADEAFPAWTLGLTGGGLRERALAPGDTVPSGARLRFKLRGNDRVEGGPFDPDVFCCDERLDPDAPEVEFFGAALYVLRETDGDTETYQTRGAPTSADSVLVLPVGPADYTVDLFVVDEHGRAGDPLRYEFVGGLAPQAPTADVIDGDVLEILDPSALPPIRESNGEPAYSVARGQQRWFNSCTRQWERTASAPESCRTSFTGAIYRMPIRLRADADPRTADVSLEIQGEFTDLPRAFSYEIRSEFDPENRYRQGIGDRLDGFLTADVVGALDLGEAPSGDYEGIEFFVPDLFFLFPWWFDPEAFPGETISSNLTEEVRRAVAHRVRADLGASVLRARAMTTALRSTIKQLPPAAAGADMTESQALNPELNLSSFGRVGPEGTLAFALRLLVPAASSGSDTVPWPPESD